MIEIRLATFDDLRDLRRVAIETQVDTFGIHNTPENMEAFLKEAYNPSQFEREFSEPGSAYYLAFEDSSIGTLRKVHRTPSESPCGPVEELAGFLRLRQNGEVEKALGPNTIELQRLYVLKKYQGKKVGALLMQKALDYARDKKFEWMWLGVWERNFKGQEFYAKWGFERFSDHVFWMGTDPQIDWLLRIKL